MAPPSFDLTAVPSPAVLAAWPLFGLRLTCGDLTLRVVTDEDAVGLAEILEEGVVAPEDAHFLPRLLEGRAATREARIQAVLAYQWAARAKTSPGHWALPFATFRDGKLVGSQALSASAFPTLRTVASSSYLSPRAQGAGIGTRMRAMTLEFAFSSLGAQRATSGFADGNTASQVVSSRLGYEPNGVEVEEVSFGVRPNNRLLLTCERWATFRPAWLADMTTEGTAGALTQLGLDGL
jgi:RimJ/RimL family protein N-acetyltransferase